MQAIQNMGKMYKGGLFFSKYQSSSAVFFLHKYTNDRGVFIDLSKWEGGVKRGHIIVPAGNNGSGWTGLAFMLRKVIRNEPKRSNIGKEDRVRVAEGVQSMGSQEMVLAKKMGVNKGRMFVNLFNENRMSTLRVDMERAVVCVRCDFSSNWAQIEKELSRYLKMNIVLQPF
ncbi:hypothetical protein LOK49_LG08G03178 [Camellia lanceoleosa]|uniref:Uncharacterized protein n=1 Tax=Camellia lanceoleosa TaxID=1840588 RepID=A0ACC0GQE2_9ERIC|nr:hypothetical protein LOK49_LG08G03178 [Camellia lanceoleosa]